MKDLQNKYCSILEEARNIPRNIPKPGQNFTVNTTAEIDPEANYYFFYKLADTVNPKWHLSSSFLTTLVKKNPEQENTTDLISKQIVKGANIISSLKERHNYLLSGANKITLDLRHPNKAVKEVFFGQFISDRTGTIIGNYIFINADALPGQISTGRYIELGNILQRYPVQGPDQFEVARQALPELEDLINAKKVTQRATAATKGRWNFGGGIVTEGTPSSEFPYGDVRMELRSKTNSGVALDDSFIRAFETWLINVEKIDSNQTLQSWWDDQMEWNIDTEEDEARYEHGSEMDPDEIYDKATDATFEKLSSLYDMFVRSDYFKDWQKSKPIQQRATDATKGKWNFGGGITENSGMYPNGDVSVIFPSLSGQLLDKFTDYLYSRAARAERGETFQSFFDGVVEEFAYGTSEDLDDAINKAINYIKECFKYFKKTDEYKDWKKSQKVQQRATDATKSRWNFRGGIAEGTEDSEMYPYGKVSVMFPSLSGQLLDKFTDYLYNGEARPEDDETFQNYFDNTVENFLDSKVAENSDDAIDGAMNAIKQSFEDFVTTDEYKDWKKSQVVQQRATDATKGKWNFRGGIAENVSAKEALREQKYKEALDKLTATNDVKEFFKIIADLTGFGSGRLFKEFIFDSRNRPAGIGKEELTALLYSITDIDQYRFEVLANADPHTRKERSDRAVQEIKQYFDLRNARLAQERGTAATKGKWNLGGGIIS